jgi:hypothetical protein
MGAGGSARDSGATTTGGGPPATTGGELGGTAIVQSTTITTASAVTPAPAPTIQGQRAREGGTAGSAPDGGTARGGVPRCSSARLSASRM